MMVERRDQVLFTTTAAGSLFGLLQQITVDERAFPNRTRHLD
jgi:hypothetical protein